MTCTRAVPVIAFLALAAAMPLDAAIYMQFEGVRGEASATGHPKWIELTSVSFGGRPFEVSAVAALAPPSDTHALSFTKKTDSASKDLMALILSGRPGKATIDFCKTPDGPAFARYTLQDALVSSYQMGGTPGSIDTGALSFTRITFQDLEKSEQAGVQSAISASPAPHLGSAGPPSIISVAPLGTGQSHSQPVGFTVAASGDCNRARIDFGDGSPVTEFAVAGKKNATPLVHAYAHGGSFQIRAYGINDPGAHPPRPFLGGCFGHAAFPLQVK